MGGMQSSVGPPLSKNVSVYLKVPAEAWKDVRTDLTVAAEGIQLAARLVDTPPNLLHATAFVEEAMVVASALEGSRVAVKVIRGQELADQGFGGLYGVGKAAVEPPALVVLSHSVGEQSQDAAATAGGFGDAAGASLSSSQSSAATGSVCFVGKGIIYDTGGLSIKTKTGMVRLRPNRERERDCSQYTVYRCTVLSSNLIFA